MRRIIATDTYSSHLSDRVNALRESEPDPFTATADTVIAYMTELRELVQLAASSPFGTLSEVNARYLTDAAMRQVRFAEARLERERHVALDILERLFRFGTVPAPHGRYDGELIALSTGLLSDPFFEWMTRLYLPWLGRTFDAFAGTGDNVFTNNAWSKATQRFGWPGYRIPSDDPPGSVRVFPFRSFPAPGLEDPDVQVLRLHYGDSPNPLPVRRMTDEMVELPGGYLLGKAHMRGLTQIRRICFFGLFRQRPAV